MSELLTEERLKEIEARCTEATPGPWYVGVVAVVLHKPPCDGHCRNLWTVVGEDITRRCAGLSIADAHFLAHCRDDVPALLTEARHLRELVARLAAENVQLRELNEGLAERVAKQSGLLTRRAEK